MSDIPGLTKDDPTFHQMCTLFGWTEMTHEIDATVFAHTRNVIEYASSHRAWPPRWWSYYVNCTRAGIALALAVHADPTTKAELERIAHTWGHVSALAIGMDELIIREQATDDGAASSGDDDE